MDLTLRKTVMKHYVYSIASYGAETWIFRKVDAEYLESFEMWCWRRMEKISRTDRVKNEVLLRDKEAKNVLHTITEGRLTGSVTSCVWDQLLCLVVRASGYYSRGPRFDSRLYHGNFPCGGEDPRGDHGLGS